MVAGLAGRAAGAIGGLLGRGIDQAGAIGNAAGSFFSGTGAHRAIGVGALRSAKIGAGVGAIGGGVAGAMDDDMGVLGGAMRGAVGGAGLGAVAGGGATFARGMASPTGRFNPNVAGTAPFQAGTPEGVMAGGRRAMNNVRDMARGMPVRPDNVPHHRRPRRSPIGRAHGGAGGAFAGLGMVGSTVADRQGNHREGRRVAAATGGI